MQHYLPTTKDVTRTQRSESSTATFTWRESTDNSQKLNNRYDIRKKERQKERKKERKKETNKQRNKERNKETKNEWVNKKKNDRNKEGRKERKKQEQQKIAKFDIHVRHSADKPGVQPVFFMVKSDPNKLSLRERNSRWNIEIINTRAVHHSFTALIRIHHTDTLFISWTYIDCKCRCEIYPRTDLTPWSGILFYNAAKPISWRSEGQFSISKVTSFITNS